MGQELVLCDYYTIKKNCRLLSGVDSGGVKDDLAEMGGELSNYTVVCALDSGIPHIGGGTLYRAIGQQLERCIITIRHLSNRGTRKEVDTPYRDILIPQSELHLMPFKDLDHCGSEITSIISVTVPHPAICGTFLFQVNCGARLFDFKVRDQIGSQLSPSYIRRILTMIVLYRGRRAIFLIGDIRLSGDIVARKFTPEENEGTKHQGNTSKFIHCAPPNQKGYDCDPQKYRSQILTFLVKSQPNIFCKEPSSNILYTSDILQYNTTPQLSMRGCGHVFG